jgi:basic membrane protein A
LVALATAGATLAGCGDSSKDDSGSTTTAAGSSSVVAGLAFDTGGRGDGTFNDSAAAGSDKAEKELGVKVQELEAKSDDDRKPNLETLADAGDNPVIAVGFLFGDTLTELAPNYPDTTFAIVDSVVEADNVRSLVFAEEQGSFLVGAAAAMKSKTGKLGFIGGQEIDLIKKFEAGFTAGAKYVNPKATVEVNYLGAAGDNAAWSSPDKAKEIAAKWYGDGADVIYTAAGGSGAGTIEAAVAAGDGKWAIGVDSDQYVTATAEQQKHILTSMLKRVDVAVFETIKAVSEGNTEGGVITFDLKSDGVGYATSGGYLDDVEADLDEIKTKIISGEIEVPTAP